MALKHLLVVRQWYLVMDETFSSMHALLHGAANSATAAVPLMEVLDATSLLLVSPPESEVLATLVRVVRGPPHAPIEGASFLSMHQSAIIFAFDKRLTLDKL